ncbi:MAG: HAD family hydrolase [Chloroflexi bacterium AL-W]|nr:HAD family hydrolase [Chloroflexi bacterium AL-N1]NOK68904.1 HAD family hydrolase [Chloroflexi bacterium AL-N10]NOK76887.1 HAD family hydrolase [Chloroflexi bacterium AL-N5]NOK82725.1 HAD family hydrolase [Chloroflexi bacterium AL-W]NOK90744.1 HAD family hydrolase [Chloroflexi bacterium AL-N15]
MPKNYLIDMDGVLVHGSEMIPGANEFIKRLETNNAKFLVLTNNPIYTPRDLNARLKRIDLQVPPEAIYTSALATAQFLHSQRPGGTAYVIGEAGLTTALHDVGYTITDVNPEYVVLGETRMLSYQQLTQAVRCVGDGARFIATNPDVSGPGDGGLVPACGAIAAMIAAATGVQPYFVGKPNPLMMRTALRTINAHSEESVMVGDRMDTDIIGGTGSGLETILVLTGVTKREEIERFPYRPTQVVDSVADIVVE